MPRFGIVLFGVVVAASPLAAQDNPFAFTGGSVKTAYIVYQENSKKKAVQGSSFEIGVAPDRWIMRTAGPDGDGGKEGHRPNAGSHHPGLAVHLLEHGWPKERGGESPDAAASGARIRRPERSGKDRFRQNLKLAIATGGSSDSRPVHHAGRRQGRLGDDRRPQVRRLQDSENDRLRRTRRPGRDAALEQRGCRGPTWSPRRSPSTVPSPRP